MIEGKVNSNYIDNKKLYEHLVKRRQKIKEAIEAGKEPPSLQNDNYLGKTILDLCNNLAYNWRFINYTYRNDMVSDAIENLVRTIDNFDPERFKNPFGYMTKIAWQAFVRRIQLEKRQQRVKGAIIQEMMIDDMFDSQEVDEDGVEYKVHFIEYLKENNFLFDDDDKKPKQKVGLEKFFE